MPNAPRLVHFNDFETLLEISKHLGAPSIANTLFSDINRADLVRDFLLVFANPSNRIMYNGDGVAAFTNIVYGWRASMQGAVWGGDSAMQAAFQRLVIAAEMDLDDLAIVDATVSSHNRASRLAMVHLGFVHTRTLPRYFSHGGQISDGYIYELSREALGLDAQRGRYGNAGISVSEANTRLRAGTATVDAPGECGIELPVSIR